MGRRRRRYGVVVWRDSAGPRSRRRLNPRPRRRRARGLAFLPKGYRLAAAHYNGVSLWFPNVVAAPKILEWKGSHLDAIVSPDGRFVVTSMQENSLHGWRLADGHNMQMTGYPARPDRSPGRTTAIGWRHRAPTPASSGRSRTRTGRWARRRANAACGRQRIPGGLPSARARGGDRLRGRVTCFAVSATGRKYWCANPQTGDGAISALVGSDPARDCFRADQGVAGLMTLPA